MSSHNRWWCCAGTACQWWLALDSGCGAPAHAASRLHTICVCAASCISLLACLTAASVARVEAEHAAHPLLQHVHHTCALSLGRMQCIARCAIHVRLCARATCVRDNHEHWVCVTAVPLSGTNNTWQRPALAVGSCRRPLKLNRSCRVQLTVSLVSQCNYKTQLHHNNKYPPTIHQAPRHSLVFCWVCRLRSVLSSFALCVPREPFCALIDTPNTP